MFMHHVHFSIMLYILLCMIRFIVHHYRDCDEWYIHICIIQKEVQCFKQYVIHYSGRVVYGKIRV